jgi:peptide/nickel transport system substrate-binding protein
MSRSRSHKLRLRRKIRFHRKQVETASSQTDKYFFRRLDRLVPVRRFVAAWMVLIVVLIGCSVVQISSLSQYYQELRPASGGVYTEGVLGAFTNANPLYATSTADRSVSKLLFSGLLQYNQENKLVGDLAESWQSDARGQTYTVTLRPDLRWSDGKPLTSADVLFTYGVIQNPDARSPLFESWQGVKVEAKDARTVTFTLANPLASFSQSLTNGIIPRHVLKDVPMVDMRSMAFNTNNPVGSGPFMWQSLSVQGGSDITTREERIMLDANSNYYSGRPNLDTFIIRTFRNEDQMLKRYNQHELNAMTGLTGQPEKSAEEMQLYNFPQTATMTTFFKTTSGVLADKTVRQAIVRATDTTTIRKNLPYPAKSADSPLLKGMLGYDATLTQLPFDIAAASKQLDEAGWVMSPGKSIREKDGQKLEFALFAESGNEAARVTRNLQQQWQKIGVNAKVELQTSADFQVTLAEHSYDALLRGISIGSDPDVFVYWHSTQADILSSGRLNFSEYKSSVADEALGSARTRSDGSLRTAKYKPFLTAWRDDAPAVSLYQPRVLYIVRDTVYGLEEHPVVAASDRYANVNEWMVRLVKTTVD